MLQIILILKEAAIQLMAYSATRFRSFVTFVAGKNFLRFHRLGFLFRLCVIRAWRHLRVLSLTTKGTPREDRPMMIVEVVVSHNLFLTHARFLNIFRLVLRHTRKCIRLARH